MHKIQFVLFIMPIFLFSCNPTKKVVVLENHLEVAYTERRYDDVLNKADRIKSLKSHNSEGLSYDQKVMAGKSAFRIQRYSRVVEFLSDIELEDQESLEALGLAYQNIGDIGNEMIHWTRYFDQLQNSDLLSSILARLFNYNYDKGNFEKAIQFYEQIQDPKPEQVMDRRLNIYEKMEDSESAVVYAKQLLEQYTENERALFVVAKDKYDKAERWYQDEMTKYNRDPNYTAYAYLRRELRKISAEFRSVRDLFIELHNSYPTKLVYPSYLRNIYMRLDMRAEAAAMDQLIKQAQ
jgi:tetratricopeptide (TPR) repeat protein